MRNPLPFENLDRVLDELDNYLETGLQIVIPRAVGYAIKFVQIGYCMRNVALGAEENKRMTSVPFFDITAKSHQHHSAVCAPLRSVPCPLAVKIWIKESSDRLDHLVVREHRLTEGFDVADQSGLISFGLLIEERVLVCQCLADDVLGEGFYLDTVLLHVCHGLEHGQRRTRRRLDDCATKSLVGDEQK